MSGNGQLRVKGGNALLDVTVRKSTFRVSINCDGDGWWWQVWEMEGDNELPTIGGGCEPTWAAAYLMALRECEKEAPRQRRATE